MYDFWRRPMRELRMEIDAADRRKTDRCRRWLQSRRGHIGIVHEAGCCCLPAALQRAGQALIDVFPMVRPIMQRRWSGQHRDRWEHSSRVPSARPFLPFQLLDSVARFSPLTAVTPSTTCWCLASQTVSVKSGAESHRHQRDSTLVAHLGRKEIRNRHAEQCS